MSNITYRRGQAEWALWQWFRLGSGASEKIPAAFSARIKKLLDLDRDQTGLTLSISGHAFGQHKKKEERANRDATFNTFDVFCLAIALDLLDAGFTQTDAVMFVRGTRVKLQTEFNRIIARYPPSSRARRLAKDHPSLPSYVANGKRIADTCVYVQTRRREVAEVHSARGQDSGRYIREPVFAYGREKLQTQLMSLSAFDRSALVIEFAGTAKLIEGFLDRAPTINRARKN